MTKSKKTPKPIPAARVAAVPTAKNTIPRTPWMDHVDRWLRQRRVWVIALLLIGWSAVRVSNFQAVANGPLFVMYQWDESDNAFFDAWARTLAAGDWLNREPLHPYHFWHREFADHYLQQHPEKLQAILDAHPDRDSTFVPGKALWNEWYGGTRYHQEPLYAYVLAVLYALTGEGVYWMLLLQSLLGVLSGLLIWLITRRYFGDTAALIAGVAYLLCGPLLFQETCLLRTSWTVFFTLLNVLVVENALESRRWQALFMAGLVLGLSLLMQTTFLLFLVGALGIWLFQDRKQPVVFLKQAGILLGGVLLALGPLIWRNAVVGAPLTSTSSVGTVTFVAANVYKTRCVNAWIPEAEKGSASEIMGQSDGRLLPATLATLQTHPSIGSYLKLLRDKLENLICGLEWTSNENYYFYRSMVPVLQWTVVDFYWVISMGVAGMLFALYFRRKSAILTLATLVQFAILLGFYVVGRLRDPLLALLIPFAAYATVECLRFSFSDWKRSVAKLVLAGLCIYFLSVRYIRYESLMFRKVDYSVLYQLNYFEKTKALADAGAWNDAIRVHSEFLKTRPELIRSLNSSSILTHSGSIEILEYFAQHYRIHSQLYLGAGNKEQADAEMARHQEMLKIAENSRNYLTK